MRPAHLAAHLALLACLAAAPAAALELGLPIDCEPGTSCWIPRYVDLDPGPGFKDFMCGDLGADKHSGTDFAIADLAAMRAGVPVLAAAAGKVRNMRDGMEDVSVETIGMAAIEGRNCGNGVVIMHGDGWETQYCHLRQGSVAVRPGDEVEAGQQLGLVGMSGEASFPHVHLSVRQGQDEVDPFRGTSGGPACGPGTAPLWSAALREQLAYAPLLLTGSGLTGSQPDWGEVQDGQHRPASLPRGRPGAGALGRGLCPTRRGPPRLPDHRPRRLGLFQRQPDRGQEPGPLLPLCRQAAAGGGLAGRHLAERGHPEPHRAGPGAAGPRGRAALNAT